MSSLIAEYSPSINLNEAHRVLAEFNTSRLEPKLPGAKWREEIRHEERMREIEGDMLESERRFVREKALSVPRSAKNFMKWFSELLNSGPGQNDPLFDWLERDADLDEMTWFIRQEVAGEAGFEDLAALTQVKLPTRAKLEVARNYWDEMGRGNERGMHGPMLARLANELKLGKSPLSEIVIESLALANILVGFAMNRRYAYHSIGALGAIELTAPGRAIKVYGGLKRLGLSREAQRYYLLHSSLDVKHSQAWNEEVIEPLVTDNPALCVPIAEGALMRLNAGARCFRRYRLQFGH